MVPSSAPAELCQWFKRSQLHLLSSVLPLTASSSLRLQRKSPRMWRCGLVWKASTLPMSCHESVQSHVDGLAMSQLAGTAFHALIDGGYTDGTGIAQAVSSGASEVVVVLNSFSINQAEYVLQLFPGGPIVKPGVPKELFPVFQSPNAISH